VPFGISTDRGLRFYGQGGVIVNTIEQGCPPPRQPFLLLRSPYRDIIQFVLLMRSWSGCCCWRLRLGLQMEWYRVPRYILRVVEGRLTAGPLLQGLGLTLKISASAWCWPSPSAWSLLCCGSPTRWSPGRGPGYLEVIRNTPMLVQLFVIYFILGPILNIERFLSAVLALSLFEGPTPRKCSARASSRSRRASGRPATAWA